MNVKKLLCLALALLIAAVSMTAALAEDADLQAQLDAANARIAELEAEVEKYRPYYESQIIAEYGEDGVVWLDDAQAQYEEAASMYASYGISVNDYADQIKQSIVEGIVQTGVLKKKAEELGISPLDEETMSDLNDKAGEDLEMYAQYYASYFAQDGASDEETHEATIAGLADAGITREALLENRVSDYVNEKLHDYVTGDVTVSDEEIQAAYEARVAEDQASYEDDDNAYNSARNSGTVIAWNPEGYRAVKQVLVKFNDEQAAQYAELQQTLSDLNDELAALDEAEAAEESGEAAEEAAEESGEAAEEAAEEPEETPRTREEIQTDIGVVGGSIEVLYSELLPTAQEVLDAYAAGTDLETLIEKYNGDPGMQNEPIATIGYAVAEDSTYWDPSFTAGAMAIPEIGQFSEPIYGANGIYLIYYLADITPGAVPFEDISDAIADEALEDKISATYNDQVAAWVEEANVVYHLDRF